MNIRNLTLPIAVFFSLLAQEASAEIFQIRWHSIRSEVSESNLEQILRGRYIPVKLNFGSTYKMNSYHAVFPNLNHSSENVPTMVELESFAGLSEMQAFNARFSLQPMAQKIQDWNIAGKSGALPVIPLQAKLESGRAYAVFGQSANWNSGITVVYVGVKRDSVASADFLARYRAHLDHKRDVFEPAGMDGQIVLIQDDYLVSFQHWNLTEEEEVLGIYANESKKVSQEEVDSVVKEAETLMITDTFAEAQPFSKMNRIYPSSAIRGMQ